MAPIPHYSGLLMITPMFLPSDATESTSSFIGLIHHGSTATEEDCHALSGASFLPSSLSFIRDPLAIAARFARHCCDYSLGRGGRMMGVFYAQESARQRRQDRESSNEGADMSESGKAKQTQREKGGGGSRAAVGFALIMTTLIISNVSWRVLSASEPGRRIQRGGNLVNPASNETEADAVHAKPLPKLVADPSEGNRDRAALIEWVRGVPGGYVADIR